MLTPISKKSNIRSQKKIFPSKIGHIISKNNKKIIILGTKKALLKITLPI